METNDNSNMMRSCWQREQKIDRDEIKERRGRIKEERGRGNLKQDGECERWRGGERDREEERDEARERARLYPFIYFGWHKGTLPLETNTHTHILVLLYM